MKTTRKILLVLVLTLAVVAVLSVCAFAFDINTDLPAGVTKEDAKWVDSGFTDVDTEDGWYLMSGSNDFSTTDTSFPTFAGLANARFYWNKTTNEAVWVVTGSNMSGNSGEEGVVSLKNVTNSTKQKFYAYASCFVDVTNKTGTDNTIMTAFAGAATEYSQYVTQSATKYPIYERYITAGKASKQWSNVNVTKAAYTDFIAYKKTLGYEEDQAVTDTAHQDQLVEWAYTNIAPYKNLVNCKENGAKFNMAWIFNQLAANDLPFASLEFRAAKGVTPYYGTVGLVNSKIEAAKILFDSKITKIAFTNTSRGLFIGNAALKTLAHVTFNEDGTYTGDVTENVVNLSGFTSIEPYTASSVHYTTSHMLSDAVGIEEVVYFNSAVASKTAGTFAKDAELAGYIDSSAFNACKSLKKITLTAPLTGIAGNAFNSCSALTTIDLKGGVAEGATVASTAFNNVKTAITVYVYSAADEARAKAAFASFTNITVENNSATEAAITADGFNIRFDDSDALYKGPALRAVFTLLKEKVDAVKTQEGYDLADYGMVIFSENTFNAYGSIDALLAAIADGLDEDEQKKIKMVSAASGPYVSVNAVTGDKTFAAAITGIEEKNYDSAVYAYAYAAWSNGAATKYTYTTYVSSRVTDKSAHSLYDATVYAYATGVVNSQTFKMSTGVELWDILSKGALSVTSAETKAPSNLLTLTQGYAYDAQGKFTYLDLPLRAWKMYEKDGKVQWNSRGQYVEAESTTGILWSILKDGNDLVVVYRADPEYDGTSTLPKLSDSYGASAPYSSKYFNVTAESQVAADTTANGLLKTATIYSPILTDANSNNIKTIVVDYGVDKFGEQSLATPSVTTIAYPEGMTSGTYLLSGCTNLKNFIYVSADKSYLDQYKKDFAENNVKSLVDLTGLAKVSDYGLAYGAAAVENVLLPAKAKMANGQQYGFSGATALSRVWTVGSDMPEAGVIDLTQAPIVLICKGYFNSLSNINDVYMPESFKGISAYSMATKGQKTDSLRWKIFGDNSAATKLNIHVANWDALNCIANTFYDAHQDPDHNDGKEATKHIVDFLQITYDGVTKTVLEWRADFPAQPAE